MNDTYSRREDDYVRHCIAQARSIGSATRTYRTSAGSLAGQGTNNTAPAATSSRTSGDRNA